MGFAARPEAMRGLGAYSQHSLTAAKGTDGAITIQFGGCDGKAASCLPTMDGTWTFPEAQPLR
jgi:hypothetical protein